MRHLFKERVRRKHRASRPFDPVCLQPPALDLLAEDIGPLFGGVAEEPV
ncbi:hypothetical protein BF49_3616 [Bradyrhizobium sp.]|nr:hypothetical protein BF49_3616 [Bradyrhizobium sp.]